MNNTITLRTWAKVKEYHFMPCKQPNGTNFPFVKPVRIMPDGSSEMILSEAERNNPESPLAEAFGKITDSLRNIEELKRKITEIKLD